MYRNNHIDFDSLLKEINRDKDTYGSIIMTNYKKIQGIIQLSFTKSPIIYLIDTVNNNAMYTFSKN